jgi:hypothetical protein
MHLFFVKMGYSHVGWSIVSSFFTQSTCICNISFQNFYLLLIWNYCLIQCCHIHAFCLSLHISKFESSVWPFLVDQNFFYSMWKLSVQNFLFPPILVLWSMKFFFFSWFHYHSEKILGIFKCSWKLWIWAISTRPGNWCQWSLLTFVSPSHLNCSSFFPFSVNT